MFRRIPFIGGGESYSDRVLSYSPIAYWQLNETSGAAAVCSVNAAQNGTYTGVTLASSTGPDGQPVPLWDGANDYCAIRTDALAAAKNYDEGTMMIWGKMSGVGVWTDSTSRIMIQLQDANIAANNLVMKRTTDNGTLQISRLGDSTDKVRSTSGLSTTGWFHLAMTWTIAGDALISYYNGAAGDAIAGNQAASNQTVIGSRTYIGAISTSGQIWSGYLAHAAIWTSILTPTQILDLATV